MNNNGAQGSEESSGPSSAVKTTVFKSLSGGSKNSYKGRPVSSAGSALSFEGRRYVTGGACSTSSRTASKENVNNGGLILVTTTTSSVNNKVSSQSLWCAGSTTEHDDDHHHFNDQCDGIAGRENSWNMSRQLGWILKYKDPVRFLDHQISFKRSDFIDYLL